MKHLDQLVGSSHHLDMPTFDAKELLGCVKHLANIDKDWLPNF
jgi:hypothetical protein